MPLLSLEGPELVAVVVVVVVLSTAFMWVTFHGVLTTRHWRLCSVSTGMFWKQELFMIGKVVGQGALVSLLSALLMT
ncbi:hypothetical protein LINPERHAP1_LOCUS24266 [Linum perenne]